MNSAYVPVLAAFGGSAISGLTSLALVSHRARKDNAAKAHAGEDQKTNFIQEIHR